MAQNYLHECLGQFPEVSEKRWDRGKPFDLEALERKVQDLRSRKVKIEDIQNRFKQFKSAEHTEHWWFDKYWVLPSLNDLSQEQQEKTFSLHQLSKANEGGPNEEEVIRGLLGAFRHIELVSIILRFICPDSFGILSPPVEHVLALPRGRDHVEVYLNYLDNLRSIRDEYEFSSAAQADMALWVLEHRCYFNGMKNQKIKQAFEKDKFMLRMRAKNMVEPIQNLTPAWRAIAFRSVDNDLAALVGCYALEKYIKKLSKVEKIEEEAEQLAKKKKKRVSLENRIEALANKGKLSFLSLGHGDLEDLRLLRNKVFHGEKISERQIELLVKTVLRLEKKVLKPNHDKLKDQT